jgi:putative transposase
MIVESVPTPTTKTYRLHSAIGYITPADRLAGRYLEIFAARDKKLDAARQNRKLKRQQLT